MNEESLLEPKISGAEEFYEAFDDLSFWKSLCPHLSITQTEPLAEKSYVVLNKDKTKVAKELLGVDGYFYYPEFLNKKITEPLALALQILKKNNISPAFAFVYDEFWKLVCTMVPLLSHLMGNDFVVLPDFFAWHVTKENPTGFSPHRDHPIDNFIDEKGMPNYLSVWVALSDVTTHDSCIYVLPGSQDLNYPHNLFNLDIDKAEKIRALPAPAGSVMGWNMGVMHWGSVPSDIANPRLSVAFCVQKKSATVMAEPVIQLHRPLPFSLRLCLIGKQMVEYIRDRSAPDLALAQALAKKLESYT